LTQTIGQNALMATATRMGRDGKIYPHPMPHGAAPDRAEAIRLEHHLRCRMGYQFRQIRDELLAEHGIRRSIGSIVRDIREFVCENCQDGLPEPGSHVTAAADGHW